MPNVDNFIGSMSLKLGSKLGVQKNLGFFFKFWDLLAISEV